MTRFDGSNFKRYPNTLDDFDDFEANNIWTMERSKKGLWVGTFDGLFHFDLRKEKFSPIENTKNQSITELASDKQGNLWFIAEGKLYTIDQEHFNMPMYRHVEKITNKGMAISNQGDIWINSEWDLLLYDSSTGLFNKHNDSPLFKNRTFSNITDIESMNDGKILIGTSGDGVYVYDPKTKTTSALKTKEVSNVYVRDFFVDNDTIWIGTESGIYVYNQTTEQVNHITKEFGNPYTISDNAIYNISADRAGGIWACTYFGGINHIAVPITPFYKYYPIPGKNSISGNAVREIAQDKYGTVWIGTEDGGLNSLNKTTGQFTLHPLKNGGRNNAYLQHDNIHGILPSDEHLWASTFEEGLYKLDAKSGRLLKHYTSGPSSGLTTNFVHGLYKTSNNVIYANTVNGIFEYDSINDHFNPMEDFPSHYGYTMIMEDHNGGLWAGTSRDGLLYYNPSEHSKRHYRKGGETDSSLSSNSINGIFTDSQNNIWVTTENGLNVLSPNHKSFEFLKVEDGFPSDIFYTVIEEKENTYWISTANGLVHYQTNPDVVEVYQKENGLLSNQFNYKSGFRDSDGLFYFGSGKGMITFNPEKFPKNENTYNLALTNLEIHDKQVVIDDSNSPLDESVAFTDQIELNHHQSSFKLEFSLLNYASNGSVQYSYQMKGLSDQWINLGSAKNVFFTELPPGNYQFSLKTKMGTTNWSPGKMLLNVKMRPPYWASSLAFVIYFLTFATVVFLIVKFYHAQIEAKNDLKIRKLKNQKEKEVYEAKIKFFTNISHEIKTPLSLIKSPLEKLLKVEYNNPEISENIAIMDKNTSRLLDLVSQLLDFRSTEMERINLTFVQTNITELVENTYLRFKPHYFDEKSLDFDLSLPEEEIFAPVDAEALKKILSNLFSNAIKYSEERISLSLKSEGDSFIIRIGNDGRLVPSYLKDKIFEPFFRMPENKDKPGSGLGLSLSLSLTELHGGTLKLDTSDGEMNIFELKIPLYQDEKLDVKFPERNISEIEDGEFSNSERAHGLTSAILLVEDNEDLLDFLAKDLTHEYVVIKARDALSSLEIIKKESIQLIISDVMMPGMDGFELCEKIKTNIEWSHIPVILLTSKSTIEAKAQGLEAGADAYIEKPFSMDYLKLQISNLIRNRQHIIEHFSSTPLAHIRSIAHTKTDENFIKKLDEAIYNNLSDHDLNVETLSDIMNMSRSTLYRKIKDISNLSPNELINIARLKRAAELLKTGNYRIYEVAQMVGYNSATNFGRNFQKQFNMSPTEYMTSNTSTV
ncbi:MAG: two-component regulator propeller domain-containing protein [Bacteroidota bacterium]|nr:two-component regulator propeller domain-containing protein [Bacteroidota bacterium]